MTRPRPTSPALERLVDDLVGRVGMYTPIAKSLDAILEVQHRETLRAAGLLGEEGGVIPIESRRHLSAECHDENDLEGPAA